MIPNGSFHVSGVPARVAGRTAEAPVDVTETDSSWQILLELELSKKIR